MLSYLSFAGRAALAGFAFGLLAALPAQASSVEGSVYTVSRHGDALLRGNINAINGEVYLAAGPSRSRDCTGGAIRDGSYYYQVTDRRTGKLITTQPITSRRFEVQGGVIRNPQGSAGDATDCGSHTIALPERSPFTDKNPNMLIGVTRVSDFEKICGRGVDCGTRGFASKRTFWRRYQMRTDNVGTAEITAFRFYDANANGRYDKAEVGMPDWIALLTADHMDNYEQFDEHALIQVRVLPGKYAMGIVTGRNNNWFNSATLTKGHDGEPNYVSFEVKPNEKRTIAFGAYCTLPTGQDPWFWKQGREGEPMVTGDDLAALRALNLRNRDGSHFDPDTPQEFATWIGSENVASQSQYLSIALASMTLSVRHGFADPKSHIMPARKALGVLMAEANTSLGVDGNVQQGDAEHARQVRLTVTLISLPDSNFDGQVGVLPSKPCGFRVPF